VFVSFTDDLVLAGSTTYSEEFTSQAGVKVDEYGQGVVSKPASAVARIAGMLVKAPMIGPFAMATQMGAHAVSSIASIFGYSRPISLEPPRRVRPNIAGNIANSSVEEATDKLTFDPKQELSIDPRICGFGDGTDELTIQSIACRPAYLNTMAWTPHDTPGTMLGSYKVEPSHTTYFGTPESGTPLHVQPLPLTFAAAPFKYWRGSLKFRFQIAKCKFHKGRLRLIYDPRGFNANTPADIPFQGGYQEIVDISELDDFVFTVGWNQNYSWASIPKNILVTPDELPSVTYTPQTWNAITPTTVDFIQSGSNGVLYVQVMNELVVPNADDPNVPSINVFVSAGDDFEVAAPESSYMKSVMHFENPFAPQSFESQSGECAEFRIGDYPAATRAMSAVYMGETFLSFRDLLKRYCYHSTETSPTATVQSLLWFWKCVRSDFPRYNLDVNNYDEAVNTSQTTLINYLTPAFVMRRGGIRWKYIFSQNSSSNELKTVVFSATRNDGPISSGLAHNSVMLPLGDPVGSSEFDPAWVAYVTPSTWSGGSVTSSAVNPGLEVELPYYDNARYRTGDAMLMSDIGNSHTVAARVQGVGLLAPKNGVFSIDCYCAAAEDFNLAFFLHVPIFRFRDQVTSPSPVPST
jgi:hypothetical protein